MSEPIEAPNLTISEIITKLSGELPSSILATRKQGGTDITYLPWHQAVRLLNDFCPKWEYRIVRDSIIEGNTKTGKTPPIIKQSRMYVVTVEIALHAADGVFKRQATGYEELLNFDGYGDASSNACAMALRRAAAAFGLGLYLYRKEK